MIYDQRNTALVNDLALAEPLLEFCCICLVFIYRAEAYAPCRAVTSLILFRQISGEQVRRCINQSVCALRIIPQAFHGIRFNDAQLLEYLHKGVDEALEQIAVLLEQALVESPVTYGIP